MVDGGSRICRAEISILYNIMGNFSCNGLGVHALGSLDGLEIFQKEIKRVEPDFPLFSPWHTYKEIDSFKL